MSYSSDPMIFRHPLASRDRRNIPRFWPQIDNTILKLGKENGVAIGLYVDSIESAINWKQRGVQYLALQTDTVSLYQHFQANTDAFHAE